MGQENIFVIHRGVDRAKVEKKLNKMTKYVDISFSLLASKKDGDAWHEDAKKKLDKCIMVICFVGKDTDKNTNVLWEIDQAKERGLDVFAYRFNKSYKLPKKLTSNFKDKVIVAPLEDETIIKKNTDMYSRSNEFNICISKIQKLLAKKSIDKLFNENKTSVFTQYQLYLKTSEDLVIRRQSVNTFFVSFCSILITLTASFITFKSDSVVLNKIGTYVWFIVFGLSIIGIVITFFWVNLLENYGQLNRSKMILISEIEKKLSLNLYDTEWGILSNNFGTKKYVSFTNTEKRSPVLFGIIFALLILTSLIIIIVSFAS
ncbi:MAG: hypothetical protein LBM99_02060 [Bacillales bacterium]|jgi:hypothetical protein|nr:hypothetical protein [Bacillales bacterium]